MTIYRVTIPPFEVEADSPEEAEEIVERRLDDDEYDFVIEDITEFQPIGGSIFVEYVSPPVGPYELDDAYTVETDDGWTSTRWRPADMQSWSDWAGHWPKSQARLVPLPNKEAP